MRHEEAFELFDATVASLSFTSNIHAKTAIGAAAVLLEQLDFHPLAITQAVSYVMMNRVSVETYIELLHCTNADLYGLVTVIKEEFPDSQRYSKSMNAVGATWILSFQKILQTDSTAAEMLFFMSLLEPKSIPRSLFHRFSGPGSDTRVDSALGLLFSYSFLGQASVSDVYNMHPLVHKAIKLWLADREPHEVRKPDLRAVLHRSLQHIAHIFPDGRDIQDRAVWAQQLPHATRLLRYDESEDMWPRYTLSKKIGSCVIKDGELVNSRGWFLEAYKWLKDRIREDDPYLLDLKQQLAEVLIETDFEEDEGLADTLLEEIVGVYKAGPMDHPIRLKALTTKALSFTRCFMNPDYSPQESLKRLWSIHEIDPEYDLVWELSHVYLESKQAEKAVELLERALGTGQYQVGTDKESALRYNLAVGYSALEDWEKAIQNSKHSNENSPLGEWHRMRIDARYTHAEAEYMHMCAKYPNPRTPSMDEVNEYVRRTVLGDHRFPTMEEFLMDLPNRIVPKDLCDRH